MDRDDMILVYEMMGHPGWELCVKELEDNFGTCVLALLGLSQADPAYALKAAYWQGRIDALWVITTLEGKIAQELREGVTPEPQDGIIRRFVRAIFKRKET